MDTRLPDWKFTARQLEELRRAAGERAKSPLTVDEERLFVRYYLKRIYQMMYLRGKKAHLAVMYANRFFIKNSLCAVNPRALIASAIVLACKVTENRLGSIDYIEKFWCTERKEIFTVEPVLLEQLRFDINVQIPHEKFDAISCMLGQEESQAFLTKEDWDTAYNILNELTTTDAVLMYSPEEVGTAVFYHIVGKKGEELATRFKGAFSEKVAKMSESTEANIRAIQTIIENEVLTPFPMDRVTEISNKMIQSIQPPSKRVKVETHF